MRNRNNELCLCGLQVTVGLLQDSLAQLKAHVAAVCPGAARFLPQTDALQEKLQRLGEADARGLQSAQSCIQHIKLQELQQQRDIRDAFREYCRSHTHST